MIMEKRERRKVKVTVVDDASQYSNITNEKLLADSEKFDMAIYNPLDSLEEKEILIPAQKTEVITIRVTEAENDLITKLADGLALSKSSYIRSIIKETINESKNCQSEPEHSIIKNTLSNVLERLKSLENKASKLESIDMKLAYLICNMKQDEIGTVKQEYYGYALDRPSYLRKRTYDTELGTTSTFKGVKPCQ